jgi:hypothetical protein
MIESGSKSVAVRSGRAGVFVQDLLIDLLVVPAIWRRREKCVNGRLPFLHITGTYFCGNEIAGGRLPATPAVWPALLFLRGRNVHSHMLGQW